MGKETEFHDVKVHDDLKVGHDLDVKGHLKVDGSLNFGRETVTQTTSTTIPVTEAVTINTSSGVIVCSPTDLSTGDTPAGTIINQFVVNNKRVKPTSTVIVSLDDFSSTVNSPLLTVYVTDIADDEFTVNVAVIVNSDGATVNYSVGYIVC